MRAHHRAHRRARLSFQHTSGEGEDEGQRLPGRNTRPTPAPRPSARASFPAADAPTVLPTHLSPQTRSHSRGVCVSILGVPQPVAAHRSLHTLHRCVLAYIYHGNANDETSTST